MAFVMRDGLPVIAICLRFRKDNAKINTSGP